MLIYLSLFVFMTVYSFIGYRHRIDVNIYLLAAMILIIFVGLRGNGYDYDSYLDIYEGTREGRERSGAMFIEPGFLLLCKICPTYQVLIFVVSVISIGCWLFGFYKISSSYLPLLGILIFFSYQMIPACMGQIRQALAIGFGIIAIMEVIKGDNIKALLIIILACTFHLSAFLLMLLFFIPKKTFNVRFYILIIIASLLLNKVFLSATGIFLSSFSSGITAKLTVYALSENQELGVTSTVIIRIITLLICVWLNKNKSKTISYLCNIYCCGIIIYLIFGFLPQLGGRGSAYFVSVDFILVPFIVTYFCNRSLTYFTAYWTVIILSAYRFLSFFSSELNYNSYIPYNLH